MAQSAPSPHHDELPDSSPDAAACPRCGGKLTNPDGLGWCPGCGYCRSLEEEGKALAAAPAPVAPKQPSLLGAAEFAQVLTLLPSWLWPLLGGSAVVAGISIAADCLLPEECLTRALWSAIQMLLAVVGLILSQLWAVLLIGADEEKVGARDVIMIGSMRLWRGTLRRLPRTRIPVWIGAWCLTALICGGTVVGGFNYWLEMVKAKRSRPAAALRIDGDRQPEASAQAL